MRLVDRTAGGEGKADLWKLSQYCLELLEIAAPEDPEEQETGDRPEPEEERPESALQ